MRKPKDHSPAQLGDYFLYNTTEDEREAKEVLGLSHWNPTEDSQNSEWISTEMC